MINEDQIVPYSTKELPVNDGPWLVFAPHADDESFGMGGTLAKAAEKGIKVELVVMTDGALGGAQQDLVEIRKKEAKRAAEVLGLEAPVFLGNRDRELQIDNKTVVQVTQQIERVSPAAVFFPGAFELHPDHRTTALLVWKALKKLARKEIAAVSYEVLMQSPINTLVDITSYIETKKLAMSAYESQLLENNYNDIALSLNRLRTSTLSTEILYAEGFNCFEALYLKEELENIILDQISLLLGK